MRTPAAVLVLFAVTACDTTTEPVPPTVYVDAVLGTTVLPAGAETEIVVRVGNAGGEPVLLSEGACRAVRFLITGAGGETVYDPAAAAADCTLGPGGADARIEEDEILAVTHRWAAVQGYDPAGESGDPLPAGTYQLTPVATLVDRVLNGSSVDITVTD